MSAAAEAVQGSGDDFLAGAGFTFDEHVDVGVRDMAQGLLDALHGWRGADERHLVGLDVESGFAETAVFEDQPPLFGGVADGGDQAVGGVGLGQEVIRAFAHALNGCGDVAMAGNQDDRDIGINVAQPLEEFKSVHVRHADVGDHHPIKVAVQRRQRGAGTAVGRHRDAVQLQGLERGAAQFVVVVDEDGVRGHWPLHGVVGDDRGGELEIRGARHVECSVRWVWSGALRRVRMNKAPLPGA